MSRSLTAFPDDQAIDRLQELEVQKLLSVEESYKLQNAMLARFQRHGVKRKRWNRLRRCDGGPCKHRRCSAACWFGGRAVSSHLTVQAHDLLRDLGLSMFFVTLVLPQYRREPGKLRQFSPNAFRQWLQRRWQKLEASYGRLLIVGAIEVSFEAELDGRTFWGPHAHFVVVGRVTKKQLKESLRPAKKLPSAFRPVLIKPVRNLANVISYAMKRAPETRRAVLGEAGRQDRQPNPLTPERAVEFDRWLLKLNVDDLLLLRGVKRVHERLALARRDRVP